VFDNIFETVNSGFAQALYEDYLRDPSSVPEEWRKLFENGIKGEEPDKPTGGTGSDFPVAPASSDIPGTPITGPALRLLTNMQDSLDIPTATSFRDIDVSRLWAIRSAFNRKLADRGIKLSFTHFIGWAIVQAAREYPVMVHAVHQHGDDYLRFTPDGVNLGLAVDAVGKRGERKLMVPVIRQADSYDFNEFHTEYERLVAGARDGKLMPDAYMGATITLTNPGTIGTVASVPRLMKGQGSIIATGAIRTVGDARLMTVTSTYDHRIIQGAESGLFLQTVDALLQGGETFYERIGEAIDIEELALQSALSASLAAGVGPPLSQPSATPVAGELLYHVAAGMSVIKNHRTHGYLAARLDPLGSEPHGDPALDPENVGLTTEIMHQIPADVLRTYVGGETLADVLPRLRDTYCGTIAYEIEHIANHDERVWLRRVIESGEHRRGLRDDTKRRLLEELTRVDVLERFLHRQYLGHKRFGIEGLDIIVPMIHMALARSIEQGTQEAVLGMSHRGRLNVLTHILGFPYEIMLAEFEGGREVEETLTPKGGTGDVKYHHGFAGTFRTHRGLEIGVRLLPNPSHLEAIDPVVEGYVRAQQTDRSGPELHYDGMQVLPILIHGDAAFAGQGVVSETFNFARLDGYSTGGTLHLIANNPDRQQPGGLHDASVASADHRLRKRSRKGL
jgi:2-oxoglutarate dehydrogenase E1 component